MEREVEVEQEWSTVIGTGKNLITEIYERENAGLLWRQSVRCSTTVFCKREETIG